MRGCAGAVLFSGSSSSLPSQSIRPGETLLLFQLLEESRIGAPYLRYVQLCHRDITTGLSCERKHDGKAARRLRCYSRCTSNQCRTIIGEASIRGLSLSSASLKMLTHGNGVAVLCSSRTLERAVMQHITDFCGACLGCDHLSGRLGLKVSATSESP